MATEIINAKISFVSLVDKAANKKSFAIIKSADTEPTFKRQVPILKTDEEQKIVTGIVYEPDVLDAHEEYMTSDSIEKAAHLFLKEFRNVDKQHDFTSGYGDVVESWVAKSAEKLGDQDIKKGTWLMSVHVTDHDTWEGIQKGDITGFSMGGVGERIEHDDTETVEKSESRLFEILKNFFSGKNTPINKGEVKDKFNDQVKRSNFWTAFNIVQESLGHWDWRSDQFIMENNPEKITEALQDFNDILTGILLSDDIVKAIGKPNKEAIEKAGKKISTNNMDQIKTAHEALAKLIEANSNEEESEVEKKEIEKAIGEGISKALEPFISKLEGVEKGIGDEPITKAKVKCPDCGAMIDSKATKCPECDAKITKSANESDNIAQIVTDAINKAIEPLNDRMDKVEKARGIAKGANENGNEETPVTKSVWDGLL